MANRTAAKAAAPFFLIAALLLPSLTVMRCNNPPKKTIGETTVSHRGGPLILAHYMPWYRGPSNKIEENMLNRYGGHWTNWGKVNPTIAEDGKARIFANQYPLTGPYHSGNTALLEYQAALMKIAGLDGVIFDWYGSYPASDFGENHEYAKAMAAVLKRADLNFLVCYEDNTLNMMGKSGAEADAIGKISFDWAQANWFKDPAYVRFEGRPVVMCFGPQHFQTQDRWNAVFSGTNPRPYFADLDNRKPWADASFNWPPMGRSVNGILTQERLSQYLNEFYSSRQKEKPYRIAGAFSAFDDAYETSYGYLDYDEGKVFNLTWEKAVAFDPAIIQIITWNDYGEGTIIEPTIERGYKELEYVQDRVREWDASFPFTKEDLRWPLEFYKLRYKQEASTAQEAAIKAATSALFAGDAAGFRAEAVKTGASVSVGD
jgi:hypothetical protein